MRSRSRAGRSSGFTVVELMIVVLLVSFLIAIAVPAFQRAQAQAQRLRCRANLQQIHLALSNYAIANDGLLPTNFPGAEDRIPFRPGRDSVGPVQDDLSRNWIGTKTVPWGLGKLHGELSDDLSVLFCPGDGDRNAAAHRQAFLQNRMLDSGDTPDCSYLYRGRDTPDPTNLPSCRFFRGDRDSVRALVMDYYHVKMDRLHHRDRICVLFEDGNTLDVRLSRGQEVDRFVFDPAAGPAGLDAIWRRADNLHEGDD